MKVLWLINVTLPEASFLLGEKSAPFGGWLINSSRYLISNKDIQLSVAFPNVRKGKNRKLKGKAINYYPFKPIKDGDKKDIKYSKYFESLLSEINPDIVHIYGTEFAHTLSMVNTCNKLNILNVISIQGLVSYCEKHLYSGLPFKAIYGCTTRNLIKKDSVSGLRRIFKKRAVNEKEALLKCNNIIGRTSWDETCSKQINPNAKYHFCNEILRQEFYKNLWDYSKCEMYSIFLSQGHYSIKGLHFALEAMAIIVKKYPKSKMYIGGKNIKKTDTVHGKMLLSYYDKYLLKLIKKFELEEAVFFTGILDEVGMCQRYLKSNVFLCPSTIENSPNSLGEAMMLGVPCVASFVGGIPDMLINNEEGFLYQHDATYILSQHICELFENKHLATKFSENAREHALKTHDAEVNTKTLIDIYKKLL